MNQKTSSKLRYTPFFFIGFDVIPQAAEEINVPPKKIGKMMILSVVLAVVFIHLLFLQSVCSESGDIASRQQGNRTCNSRCDGKSVRNHGHGKGYHCRWNVRYRYILELLHAWWFPCNVLHGRILHDSEILCKASSEAQNSC